MKKYDYKLSNGPETDELVQKFLEIKTEFGIYKLVRNYNLDYPTEIIRLYYNGDHSWSKIVYDGLEIPDSLIDTITDLIMYPYLDARDLRMIDYKKFHTENLIDFKLDNLISITPTTISLI